MNRLDLRRYVPRKPSGVPIRSERWIVTGRNVVMLKGGGELRVVRVRALNGTVFHFQQEIFDELFKPEVEQ